MVRQPGIIREIPTSAEKRHLKDECRRSATTEEEPTLYSEYVLPSSLSVTAVTRDMEAEHHHLPGYSEGSQEVMGYGTTLLQVPAVVVAPPRESSSTGNPLPKQNSQPELCSESRPVVQQLGQHPNMTRSLESLGSMGASTGYLQPSCSNPQQQQQLPFMQLLVKPSTRGPTSGTSTLASSSSLSAAQSQMANSLRKIQPKPSSEEGRLSVKEEASFYKKEAYHQQPPLIRLTPSEDVHTPGNISHNLDHIPILN